MGDDDRSARTRRVPEGPFDWGDGRASIIHSDVDDFGVPWTQRLQNRRRRRAWIRDNMAVFCLLLSVAYVVASFFIHSSVWIAACMVCSVVWAATSIIVDEVRGR